MQERSKNNDLFTTRVSEFQADPGRPARAGLRHAARINMQVTNQEKYGPLYP
jgi:hypothetical protein